MNLKLKPIRSKRYLAAAKGQPCTMTKACDGTVVACHYSGLHSNRLGKGAGIKAQDLFIADLCFDCHQQFDQYTQGRDYEQAFAFAMAIFETQWRRVEQGLLKVEGMK